MALMNRIVQIILLMSLSLYAFFLAGISVRRLISKRKFRRWQRERIKNPRPGTRRSLCHAQWQRYQAKLDYWLMRHPAGPTDLQEQRHFDLLLEATFESYDDYRTALVRYLNTDLKKKR